MLDIGSGWGGLGLYLAERSQVDVTGVTLSEEQHKLSNERAENAGLNDRVRFELRDYRHVEGEFDRIVSVGMFEHVGIGHYREFFDKCRSLLKDDGVALLHTIGRADGPGFTNPWIDKYIFPGGYCPALSEVVPVIEKAGLYINDVEVLRLHYAETLRHWRERFLRNVERARALLRRPVLPHVGTLPGCQRNRVPLLRPGGVPDPGLPGARRRCRSPGTTSPASRTTAPTRSPRRSDSRRRRQRRAASPGYQALWVKA